MDCSIIIPVGPGHDRPGADGRTLYEIAAETVIQAIQETPRGEPFDDYYVVGGQDRYLGEGRSALRNLLVRGPLLSPHIGVQLITHDTEDRDEEAVLEAAASTTWLFFLDADDIMCSEAVCRGQMGMQMGRSPFKVLGEQLARDPDLQALWGGIFELQDDRTTAMVAALDAHVVRGSLIDLMWWNEISDWRLREPILRGMSHLYRGTKDDNRLARGLFEEHETSVPDVDGLVASEIRFGPVLQHDGAAGLAEPVHRLFRFDHAV